MPFCEKCGTEYGTDVKFCTNCGAPTATPSASPITAKQTTEIPEWKKRYDLQHKRRQEAYHAKGFKAKKLKVFVLLIIVFGLGVFVGFVASTHPVPSTQNTSSSVGSAQIENEGAYTDALGYYHAVGEVQNTGNASLGFVQINGIFRDSAGLKVYENWTFAENEYLPSGEKTPFDLIIWDTYKSSQVSSYTLSVLYELPLYTYSTSLSVVNTSGSVNGDGMFEVDGSVMNNGPSTSAFTQVYGTFYNAQGRVIYVDSTFTTSTDIPSGQQSDFTLTVLSQTISSQVKSYSISAETDESYYTSMPQTGVASTSSPSAITEAENQSTMQPQTIPQQQSTDLVEYCFSSPQPPHGDCDQRLIYWFNQANVSIHIMIYSFTLSDVADALIRAKQRGVDVKIAWDKTEVSESGSQYQKLENAGIDIRIDREPGIDLLHDKVAIIDNHIIITGSFNWSNEANLHDRENIVVINSINWATAYEQNFQEIWNASTP